MKPFFIQIILYFAIFIQVEAYEDQKVLNVYNWSTYIDESVIKDFEVEYGIKVNYSVFDTNQMLESKLLISSGLYDVVVPGLSPFLLRQIKLGIYEKLDKSRLTNYKNLDPKFLSIIAKNNDSTDYAIPYHWGSTGIGYNVEEFKKIFPDVEHPDLSFIFDESKLSKLQECGVEMLDEAIAIMPLIKGYLGIDLYRFDLDSLNQMHNKLFAIRKYLKSVNANRYMENIANGNSCLVIGYSGDILQARDRAIESGNMVTVKFVLPKEVFDIGVDMMGITAASRNKDAAYKFINFILRADIAGRIVNKIKYPNANLASRKFINHNILSDKEIFTDINEHKNVYIGNVIDEKYLKSLNKIWLKFVSGSS